VNTARDMACDHLNCPASYPRSTAPHSVECDKLTAAIEADRSQRDRSRVGLHAATVEACAKTLDEQGEKLYAMMEARPIGDKKREQLSRRASEWFAARDRLRSLTSQPGGERK